MALEGISINNIYSSSVRSFKCLKLHSARNDFYQNTCKTVQHNDPY